MKGIEAYGSWPSSIGSADLVAGALRLSAPSIEESTLYWLEGRPSEGGRQAVMAVDLLDSGSVSGAREVSPPEANVRTRVHEYGGGEYAVWRDRLFYVDDRDGSVRAGRIGYGMESLVSGGSAYADLRVCPSGRWLWAVEERPRPETEPENRIVAFALDQRAEGVALAAGSSPIVVAAGHDFYASLVVRATGDRVAYLAWDHPNMPWNGTVLEVLDWGENGPAGEPRQIAGGRRESIFQPRFGPDGALYAASDRSGWWNLCRIGERGIEPIHRCESEWGRAQWVFGQSSWVFDDAGQILGTPTCEGRDQLERLDPESGRSRSLATPFHQISGLQADGGWVTCVGGSPTHASGVYAWRLEGGAPTCVREGSSLAIAEDSISRAEARQIGSRDGRVTHAFVYPPTSDRAAGPAAARPPLLVKSHGGPTSATTSALDPRIQFWTSRGFAVADVNYGGSTGYGREYRDRLEGAWGVVDVEDCVAVAQALADQGEVAPDQLAISGGSAGGYTTLCALTFHDLFAAGASHYGIGDLEALARDTHKFECRYTDWLVGELPRDRARYRARSPVHHPERLGCPMIFFQGLEDRVVPPNQAEAMVAVLASRGILHAYVPFEGEQHGFRRAENIRTALDGELYFYSRVFGFDAPQPPGVRVVEAV